MNATAKFAIVGSSGYTARFRAQPRVEKANASNAAHGERRDNAAPAIVLSPSQPRIRLSQIETAKHAPDWNGPRLTAPFVAQVLGQVLAQDGDAKPSTAYRGDTKFFRALLCDRRV
jgi:hypothetical protein